MIMYRDNQTILTASARSVPVSSVVFATRPPLHCMQTACGLGDPCYLETEAFIIIYGVLFS